MERTHSMDMRSEREDLKAAAEQSLNVILDLALDGSIRWVSSSWKDVVGTPVESVKNKSIADILLSDRDAFANAIQSMKEDDSKSRVIRFQVLKGPFSVLKPNIEKDEEMSDGDSVEEDANDEEQVLNLEGQGIMVYDRSSEGEGHVRRSKAAFITLIEADLKLDNVDATPLQPTKRNHHRPPGASCRVTRPGS